MNLGLPQWGFCSFQLKVPNHLVRTSGQVGLPRDEDALGCSLGKCELVLFFWCFCYLFFGPFL